MIRKMLTSPILFIVGSVIVFTTSHTYALWFYMFLALNYYIQYLNMNYKHKRLELRHLYQYEEIS